MTMLQTGKTMSLAQPPVKGIAKNPATQPGFSWTLVESWEASLSQQIDRAITTCQEDVLAILTGLLQEKELSQASFAQRIVSDRLQDEGTAGLPDRHPLHWFQSQLEFQMRGLLEFPSPETAQQYLKELLAEIRPNVDRTLLALQTEVSQLCDRHVQQICLSLAVSLQPELKGQRIVLSEYINSFVPLPRMQLRAVDRFSWIRGGKRLISAEFATEVQKTITPWYLGGLSAQQQICYQLDNHQIIAMVTESLERSSQELRNELAQYLSTELRERVQRLLASIE
jgi:hypothetical protein